MDLVRSSSGSVEDSEMDFLSHGSQCRTSLKLSYHMPDMFPNALQPLVQMQEGGVVLDKAEQKLCGLQR